LKGNFVIKKVTFFFIVLILIFVGCKKLNPDEEIPSYIYVPYCDFTTDSLNQGTKLQDFSDIWVFIGDDFIGCFPVGSRIPVLAEGNKVIKMRAGIKNVGIESLRSIYPMAQFYETNVDLKRGQVQTVIPNFTYFSGISFLRLESFSNPGTIFSPTPSADTFLTVYSGSGPEAIPGQGNCGFVYLDSYYQVFDAITGSAIPYQIQGRLCYLEMHYKTNVNIFVSVSNGFNDIRLCAQVYDTQGQWKKTYIPLTENINVAPTLSNFYLVLRASTPSGGPEPRIYLDNIKIIRQ
jgi:hypothetical protein